MNEETSNGQVSIPSGGERFLHEKMRTLILRERKAFKQLQEERRKSMRTRFILLGNAIILALTAILLLFGTLEGLIGIAATASLFLLAAATFFLLIVSTSNVRAEAQRLELLKHELALVEREIEEYHSAPGTNAMPPTA